MVTVDTFVRKIKMRKNLFTLAILTVACLQQAVSGQGSQQNNSFPARPASFTFQDQGKQTAEQTIESMEETIKRLELRLTEVEDDVAKKIAAEKRSNLDDKANDLAARIADLEKSAEKSEKSMGKLQETLPGLVFHSHKTPKMQFFGRIHLDYWAFPKFDDSLAPLDDGNPQDRFNFRRMRIGIKGDLNDNMFYKYEGEFAGGNNPSYRDAILGFKHVPLLETVVFGNHKRPYGLDHLNSSRHNVFIERPFVVEAFNQDARRLGISSNGVSDDLSTNWRFGYWNQILTQTRSGYISDNYQGELAGRLARTFWWDESSGGRGYGHFAISGSIGDPDDEDIPAGSGADYRTRPEARSDDRWLDTGAISGAEANYLIGLEGVLNIGAFNITGEYMRVNVDRRDGVGEDVAFDGYYGQISYFLTGEHRAWNRKNGTLDRVKPFENFFMVKDRDGALQSGWGAWELAARYSHADLTDFDILGGEGESLTIGMNWYWNAYARMQFNYITGRITNAPSLGDYEIFGIRMMVDF